MEVNRTTLSNKSASISVGPYGAYLTLNTWQDRTQAAGPRAMNRLDQQLVSVLSSLLGINFTLMGNGVRGLNPNLPGGIPQPATLQNPQIQEALPPIIDKYVDGKRVDKIGETHPIAQPYKPTDNQPGNAPRIEVGGSPSLGDLMMAGNGESSLGRLTSVPKPYMPNFNAKPIQEAPMEAEIGTGIFESKADNDLSLVNPEDKMAKTMAKKSKQVDGKESQTVFFNECQIKDNLSPQVDGAQNNYQQPSPGDEEDRGSSLEDDFDFESGYDRI